MKKAIVERVLKEAEFLIETKKTLREIATHFNVSKSTVHKDLHERLLEIDSTSFSRVKKIMEEHINERHIRGGESTKRKYLNLK